MDIFGQFSEKFGASCLQPWHAADLRKQNCLLSYACLVNFVLGKELKNVFSL